MLLLVSFDTANIKQNFKLQIKTLIFNTNLTFTRLR